MQVNAAFEGSAMSGGLSAAEFSSKEDSSYKRNGDLEGCWLPRIAPAQPLNLAPPCTEVACSQFFGRGRLTPGNGLFCGMRSPGRAGTAISCKGLPSINPVFQHEHRAPRRGRISRITPVNILGAYRVILSPDIGQCLTLILAWVANVD